VLKRRWTLCSQQQAEKLTVHMHCRSPQLLPFPKIRNPYWFFKGIRVPFITLESKTMPLHVTSAPRLRPVYKLTTPVKPLPAAAEYAGQISIHQKQSIRQVFLPRTSR
jgi:hypothetical protein